MRNYLLAETLKQKKSKRNLLGFLIIVVISFVLSRNLYRLTDKSGLLDFYFDNAISIILVMTFFVLLYSISLIGDEFTQGTIYSMYMSPLDGLRFFISKVFMIILMNIIVMVFITVIMIVLLSYSGHNIVGIELLTLMIIDLMLAVLLPIAMMPALLLIIMAKGNFISSFISGLVYILIIILPNQLHISEALAQDLMAYGYPIGNVAVIYNWIINKLVPYEVSLMKEPKQSAILATLILLGYVVLSSWLAKKYTKKIIMK